MSSFTQAHERLKNSIHAYWRQNQYLAPRSTGGKVFMSLVYFSVPVVIGYYVSTQAVAISESTVEERFGNSGGGGKNDKTPSQQHPIHSTNTIEEDDNKIMGVGVQMVHSDQRTQEVNRINLERFLKKQQRLKQKREREAAEKEAAGQ